MARITVEDCLKKVNNRFALIHMAASRVRQLRKGAEPSIRTKNKDIVISLREIAAGNVIVQERPEGDYYLEGGPEALLDLPEQDSMGEQEPPEAQKDEEDEIAEG